MEEEKIDNKVNKVKNEIVQWVISIGIACVLALTLRTYVFASADVQGTSMLPTLNDKDKIFVEKVSLYTSNLKRGQIIIFDSKNENRDIFVKRIIGVEGDTIEIINGKVYLNSKLLSEPYLKENVYTNEGPVFTAVQKLKVPKGCVFVLGDNREVSLDSRFIGPINIKDIKGHVIFRALPINTIRGF